MLVQDTEQVSDDDLTQQLDESFDPAQQNPLVNEVVNQEHDEELLQEEVVQNVVLEEVALDQEAVDNNQIQQIENQELNQELNQVLNEVQEIDQVNEVHEIGGVNPVVQNGNARGGGGQGVSLFILGCN